MESGNTPFNNRSRKLVGQVIRINFFRRQIFQTILFRILRIHHDFLYLRVLNTRGDISIPGIRSASLYQAVQNQTLATVDLIYQSRLETRIIKTQGFSFPVRLNSDNRSTTVLHLSLTPESRISKSRCIRKIEFRPIPLILGKYPGFYNVHIIVIPETIAFYNFPVRMTKVILYNRHIPGKVSFGKLVNIDPLITA